jgi:putative DNA primase/helicase
MSGKIDIGDLHASVGREHTVEAIERNLKTANYTRNDDGRAKQFVDDYGHECRYVPALRRWLLWSGQHWRVDEDGGIKRLAVENSRRLLAEACRIDDHAERTERVKHALAMGDRQTVGAMLEFASVDQRIVLRHEALDGDPFLLGVHNGVVDLRAGTFRDGQRTDAITKRAGTEYQADAECPRWRRFLSEVLRADTALVTYLQKLVGYTLTGDVSAQCFPFLYGGGKNGKSVFTETLMTLLGEYAQRAPQSLLTASNGREPTHEVARLQGARLVMGSETEEGLRLAESRVKDITGGDTLSGRCLYAEAFDFRPQLKLWLYGNHKPEIRGTDEGLWRRVRLVPFTVQISESDRDPMLAAKLREELPGILNWALEGTRLWLQDGLHPPAAVIEASADYRDEEDTLADFIAGEMEESPGGRVPTAKMYVRYQDWAQRSGFRFPLSDRGLNKRLKERGLRMVRSDGKRYWEGIALT